MQKVHINLLKDDAPLPSYQTHRSPLVPILISFAVFFLLLGGSAAFSYQGTKDENSGLSKTWHAIVGFTPLAGLAQNPDVQLASIDDRINILLFGIGGTGHDGPELTDTIILVSIKPSTHQVALFSIPRDLLANIPGHGWQKINSANAFGEEDNPGKGGEFASQVISNTFNIPVQYYVRVDFKAFVDIVNMLGGVTVTVDKPFTDYTYPTYNDKIQTISFVAGTQTMDGERALEFARSRHSLDNNEGSDFARSHRQQKVLVALKNEIFSSSLFFRPQKIGDIISSLQQNISTNMQIWEILTLGNVLRDVDFSTIHTTVFDDSPQSYLNSRMLNGAYVLQPRSGSFDQMHNVIQTIFDQNQQTVAAAIDTTIGTHTSVAIKNGTRTEGLATRTAALLKKSNFTIQAISNALARSYQKTVMYDLTGGAKTKQLDYLKNELNADVVYDSYSKELDGTQGADFLIILGQPTQTPPPTRVMEPTSSTETIVPVQ